MRFLTCSLTEQETLAAKIRKEFSLEIMQSLKTKYFEKKKLESSTELRLNLLGASPTQERKERQIKNTRAEKPLNVPRFYNFISRRAFASDETIARNFGEFFISRSIF